MEDPKLIAQEHADRLGVDVGNLFGKVCLKTGKKAFVAFFEGEMVFKIGREEAALLMDQYPGAQLFDPSKKGRPMKDWLQVPKAYDTAWDDLAQQALEFVQEIG